jgi:hypothetical protein
VNRPVIVASVVLCAKPAAIGSADILHDNAPLLTGTIAEDGTLAPLGAQWSEVQHDRDDLSVGNTVLGFNAAGNFDSRLSDDFIVGPGEVWNVASVRVFAYRIDHKGSSSPISHATLRLWNGPPDHPRSKVVFGDEFTNRLLDSSDAGAFRIGNSLVPFPVDPDLSRKIWTVDIGTLSQIASGDPLSLLPGDYWIDWNVRTIDDAPPFSPAATPGSRLHPRSVQE